MKKLFQPTIVLLIVCGFLICSPAHGQQPTPPKALTEVMQQLKLKWPENRTIRFVFHGHSVPAGYFKTPIIQRFDSYPLLFQQQMGKRFPTAAIDVCVTAIGGENSESGASRFANDVLSLRPDVVFIDYSLNDRRLSLEQAKLFWEVMIVEAKQNGIPVVLMTATPDSREDITSDDSPLQSHADQVRQLGKSYEVPVIDSYGEFQRRVRAGEKVSSFLSQTNHPNRDGHEIVTKLIMALFPTEQADSSK